MSQKPFPYLRKDFFNTVISMAGSYLLAWTFKIPKVATMKRFLFLLNYGDIILDMYTCRVSHILIPIEYVTI